MWYFEITSICKAKGERIKELYRLMRCSGRGRGYFKNYTMYLQAYYVTGTVLGT